MLSHLEGTFILPDFLRPFESGEIHFVHVFEKVVLLDDLVGLQTANLIL